MLEGATVARSHIVLICARGHKNVQHTVQRKQQVANLKRFATFGIDEFAAWGGPDRTRGLWRTPRFHPSSAEASLTSQ
jgi:hypothetical protein